MTLALNVRCGGWWYEVGCSYQGLNFAMWCLQCIDDNYFIQVPEELMRRGVLSDLVLINKDGLVGHVMAGSSLGWRDHETVAFNILRRRRKAIYRIASLNFRRANSDLFKDLPGGIPWAGALENKEAHERRLSLKFYFFWAQDWYIPKSKKLGKSDKRLVWMSKELVDKLKEKKKVHEMQEKELSTWKEYRNVFRPWRNSTRKTNDV